MLHIHIYREWYGDRRAYPATEIGILETDDNGIVAKKLLKYRNVKNPPQIKSSLF
jgi:hypothetical protein